MLPSRTKLINLKANRSSDEDRRLKFLMDEQQGNFKVTDRRLFNADGSPREVPPEERPAAEPVKTEAPIVEDKVAQPTASTEQAPTEANTYEDVEEALDR